MHMQAMKSLDMMLILSPYILELLFLIQIFRRIQKNFQRDNAHPRHQKYSSDLFDKYVVLSCVHILIHIEI